MEPAQRNLMIGYAVVCFLSLIGVSLNLVSIFNIGNIDTPQMSEALAQGLTYGFSTIAAIYMLITLFSLVGILKKSYSKKGLMLLVLLLLITFVFGHFIFDLYVDPDTI